MSSTRFHWLIMLKSFDILYVAMILGFILFPATYLFIFLEADMLNTAARNVR